MFIAMNLRFMKPRSRPFHEARILTALRSAARLIIFDRDCPVSGHCPIQHFEKFLALEPFLLIIVATDSAFQSSMTQLRGITALKAECERPRPAQ